MERIDQIWRHPVYQEQFQALQKAEKERIFCRHTLEHFLDVARLMYIRRLEEQAELSKETIYAAALLHDIGRYQQISNGTPHDEASALLAGQILSDCGFEETQIQEIMQAIRAHRAGSMELLGDYLYKADKQSRNCFACPASAECNWTEEKRNLKLKR